MGLTERAVTVVNTSDADMVSAFASGGRTAVVTWNPLVSEILAMPKTAKVFDSSRIPGEIIDLLVVNTETLEANPALGKALVGAWYETMAIMSKDDEAGRAARTAMAKASGTDLAGYDVQLASTKMFFEPAEAVAFAKSEQLPLTMEEVASFSFDHGLLGEGAPNAGFDRRLLPRRALLRGPGQSQAALRCGVYADGGGRGAVSREPPVCLVIAFVLESFRHIRSAISDLFPTTGGARLGWRSGQVFLDRSVNVRTTRLRRSWRP